MAKALITSHTLEAGGSIIQVRNIAELLILKDISYKRKRKNRTAIGALVCIVALSLFTQLGSSYATGTVLEAAFAAMLQMGSALESVLPASQLILWLLALALFAWGFATGPTYELQLQTNAGTISMFRSRKLAPMKDLVDKIRDAMRDSTGSYEYHYNDSSVNISNSDGTIFAGNNAKVDQSIIKERVRA